MRRLLIFALLLVALPLSAQVNLPAGTGWSPLSAASTCGSGPCQSTVLTGSVADPGTIANGEYTDDTQTALQSYNFTANLTVWFDDWGGGWGDDVNKLLCMMGGGHHDSWNNEVACLNLVGSSPSVQYLAPVTTPVMLTSSSHDFECQDLGNVANGDGLLHHWIYRDLSSGTNYSSAGTQGSLTVGPCARPTARHHYEGLQFVPALNEMFMFGGFLNNLGDGTKEVWILNETTGAWTRDTRQAACCNAPLSVASGEPLGAFDPASPSEPPANTDKILAAANTAGTPELRTYIPSTGVWSAALAGNYSNFKTTASFAVDTDHHVLLETVPAGSGSTGWPTIIAAVHIYAWDLTQSVPSPILVGGNADWNNTNQANCFTSSNGGGYQPISLQSGLQYDHHLGLFVAYPGGGNELEFINAGSSPIVTAYGTVPAQQCLIFTLGSTKCADYPCDPSMEQSGGACQTGFVGLCSAGINGRFSYFPTEDVFVLWNSINNPAFVLRLAPNPTGSASIKGVVGGNAVAPGSALN